MNWLRRAWVANALLVLISLSLAIAAAEAALRIFFQPRALLTRQLLVGLGVTDSDQAWEQHPDRGWMIKPNQTFRHVSPYGEFDTPIRTEELGLRVPLDRDLTKQADRTILFVGDSVTAAYEVPYDDTFVAKVEEKLSAAGQPRWRGLNAGVRGYSTEQSFKHMRSLLERRELGITDVVYLFSQNDPFENMSLHFPKRLMSKPGAYLDQNGALKFLTLDYPVGVFDADALFVEPGGKVGVLPVIGRTGVSRRVMANKLRYTEQRGGLRDLYLVGLARLAIDIIAAPDSKAVRERYPYINAEYAPDDDGGYSPGHIDVSWEPGSYPLRLLEKIIVEMQSEAERKGSRFWLATVMGTPSPVSDFLQQLSVKYQIRVIDPVRMKLTQKWVDTCGGTLVFKTDGHYTPCAHSGQAEAIAAALTGENKIEAAQ